MKHRNLKEYPSEQHIKKVSHWANLKQKNHISFVQIFLRRVFFCIFRKKVRAVLSVEAALSVPIFILAMCMMMGVLDCYRIQSMVKASIHQSAMELGVYAVFNTKETTGAEVLNSSICLAYAQARLPEFEDNVSVSMLGSHYTNHTVTLIAHVEYRFPIQLFPMTPLTVVNVSEVYSWVGESPPKEDETPATYEMVYVTEHGKVYHTSSSCSHIDIKIYETTKLHTDGAYVPCAKCCRGEIIENNQSVYYTRTGDCYHARKDCASLKRTVRMVESSEVKGWSLCERCEKKGTV